MAYYYVKTILYNLKDIHNHIFIEDIKLNLGQVYYYKLYSQEESCLYYTLNKLKIQNIKKCRF